VLATTKTSDTPMSLLRQFCGEDDHHPITQLTLQAIEGQRWHFMRAFLPLDATKKISSFLRSFYMPF